MGLKLTFEIELCTDYHVSAGHGLGALVDSALHRDADGLPVLRGTTLTGLLRDGLYRLLQLDPLNSQKGYVNCEASGLPKGDGTPRFCGQHNPEQKDCPVCRIFGSPRTIKRWRIGSARLSDLPLPVTDGWTPGQTGGQVAPHVRINPRTRRAEARKLFFREEGDARLGFCFSIACDADDATALEEAAWLVAAARYVRHLGASRRRGRGECRIHLVDGGTEGDCLPPLDEALAELQEAIGEEQTALNDGRIYEQWLLIRFQKSQLEQIQAADTVIPTPRQEIPLLQDTGEHPDFSPSEAEGQKSVRLLLIARLDEPLIISEKAEAGNEFYTVNYIPGSSIRGALAGRVAAQHDLDQAEVYAAFVRLFFRGGVVFPSLYPARREDKRIYPALPAPLDLFSCELYSGFAPAGTFPRHGAVGLTAPEMAARQGGTIFDLSEDLLPRCPVCHSRMKPLGGFLGLHPVPKRIEPTRVTEMHVHIDPITRRAAGGDLFGFDALAPGQYLVGEMTCADAAAWEDLSALAGLPLKDGQITLRLGKANRRGYGQVTLWIERQKGREHPWYQLSLSQRVTDPKAPLVLTLLTDAIVPDRWGRFQTSFDNAWLGEALGVKVEVKHSFCASRAVDAFNAHLGLPRWRDVALRAGSAVRLEIAEAIDLPELLKRLGDVERRGLGLRRNEGLGRVVFNHPLYNGCARVRDSRIPLPEQLHPARGGRAHPLLVETEFRREWDDFLVKQDCGTFSAPEFESLARLLRGEAPASIQEVNDLLKGLGRSGQLLPKKVMEELKVREAEKDKLNFFRAGRGKSGLDAVKKIVKELGQRTTESERRWRIGLEMLANYMAAEAQKRPSQAETEFRQKWAKILEEQDWKTFREPEFEALARLLHSERPASVQQVKAMLERLSRSDQPLAPGDAEELTVGESEKVKLHFFRTGKGQAGLHALRNLVEELEGVITKGGRCWRVGLEMVANRIAAEARQAKEEQ